MTNEEKIAATAKLYPPPLTAAVRYIHYGIAEDGHVWIRQGHHDWAVRTLLCSPFTIAARLDSRCGRDGIRVIIEDMTGKPKTVDIQRSDLKSRTSVTAQLVACGMRLAPGGADVVLNILRSANPQKGIDIDAECRARLAALTETHTRAPKPTSAIREDAF